MTLEMLLRMSKLGGEDGLRCRLLLWKFERPTYDDWASSVEEVVFGQIAVLARKSHLLQGLSEDQLTAFLILSIEGLGLTATSQVVNGNCDVVVSFDRTYMWIAEAKIFKGVGSIWEGYLQLSTRYATSLPGSSRGGMLVYCFSQDAASQCIKWRGHLAKMDGGCSVKLSEHPLVFSSESNGPNTGLPFKVAHFVFPLFHRPLDKSGRGAKKHKAS